MDVARDLGWKEGAPAPVMDETEEQAERSGGSGMGVSVSVISSPQEDEEAATGLHASAMKGDIAATSAFLHAGEDLDIDARDEYVSKASLPRNPWRFFLIVVGIHRAAFGC